VHGTPNALRMDNGPELTFTVLTTWCEKHHVALRFIQPGKPQQNDFIERLNRTYRTEVLDAYEFTHLEDVRTISDDFLLTYNAERAHDSLGRVPPLTFLSRPNVPPKSRFDLST
jgi:putative transposase